MLLLVYAASVRDIEAPETFLIGARENSFHYLYIHPPRITDKI